MNQQVVEAIVKEVLLRVQQATQSGAGEDLSNVQPSVDNTENLVDITSPEEKGRILIPNPENREELERMKKETVARIGVGRAGPRLKTQTYLTLKADHALAKDAVLTKVSEELLEKLGLFSVATLCKDQNEYLTRPDYGRDFSEETKKEILAKCTKSPQVQIIISDGLSSSAIESNIENIFPSLMDSLADYKLKVGTPFFIKYGRVPAMDAVSELLDAEVTCVLIGERPGLASADSMSAYIAYRGEVGMPEARRTVVSNIHAGGISAVEAGAYVAEVIDKILKVKTSGVDLKL